MNTENILVPLDKQSKDLKPLYHAFSLAERIKAKVSVVFFKDRHDTSQVIPFEKACIDMVQSAREEEISVSFHIANDHRENELLNIVRTEHIDLIVISADDSSMESSVKAVNSKLSVQVIKVKGKNNINF